MRKIITATITIAFLATIALSPSIRHNTLDTIFNNKLNLRLPKRLQEYADHGLPAEYAGPRMRTWKNGIEQ